MQRSADSASSYSYVEAFARRIAAMPGTTKRARTRDALKLAALNLLGRESFTEIKITEICRCAGIANGTFYIYFPDKISIAKEVLEEFMLDAESLAKRMRVPPLHHNASLFDRIFDANLHWLRHMKVNAGLYRCIFQVAEELTEFADLASKTNHDWYAHVAKRLLDDRVAGPEHVQPALLAVYGLGAMMDELCRKLVLFPDRYFLALVSDVAASDEALAEFLSLIWHRALFGRDPQQTMSAPVSRALAQLWPSDK